MAKKHRDPLARIKKGAGTGTGSDYVSPIHHRDFSSVGKTSRMRSHTNVRVVQTFSGIEACLYPYLDFYPDFIDVREQFIHMPLTETLAICQSLGIKHPMQRGELFPISTDFVVTRRNGLLQAIEVKAKPEELLDARDREKHLVRKIWWQVRDVPYDLVHPGQICRTVSNNILRIQQGCFQYQAHVAIDTHRFADDFLRVHSGEVPLAESLSALLADRYKRSCQGHLLRALFMAIKGQLVHVDLRMQIAPLFPLRLVATIDDSADWPW